MDTIKTNVNISLKKYSTKVINNIQQSTPI